MPASLSTVAVRDGNTTLVTGGVQALDNSGTGNGPFTFAHLLIDGIAGAIRATVKAASTGNSVTDTALVVTIRENPVASTGTQSSVASSATDVTILAANAARRGATLFNDSTQVLYLLLASGTSSTSNYSVQIAAGGYYELPFNYQGILKGIWASANGNARVTELT